MTISTQRLRLLRGNTAAASAFTGYQGELIVDTDLRTIRVQDGITAGGSLIATQTWVGNVVSNVTGNAGPAGTSVTNANVSYGNLYITLSNSQVINAGYVMGEQGPVGPAGLQGIQGNVGPQGIQGNTGPTGPQGIQGNVGPQGIQGIQGIQGNVGPQGIQGIQGNVGPQGIQGIQGIQGNTGAQGVSVTLKGTLALIADLNNVVNPQQGDAWIVTESNGGDLYFYDSFNQWDNIGKIVGPEGPRGPQGIQGNTGAQGIQGIQGNVGPQGPQGVQGVPGNQGIQGDTGPTGPAGPTGPQGIQGNPGQDGVSFVWRGEYDALATAYNPNEVVSYLGSSYIALQGNYDTPPTNTAYWQLMAQKGMDGAGGSLTVEDGTTTVSNVSTLVLLNGGSVVDLSSGVAGFDISSNNGINFDSVGAINLEANGVIRNSVDTGSVNIVAKNYVQLQWTTPAGIEASDPNGTTEPLNWLYVDQTGIHLETNVNQQTSPSKSWDFANDGTMRFPDGTYQTTAYVWSAPSGINMDGGGASVEYEMTETYVDGGFSSTRHGIVDPVFDAGNVTAEINQYKLDGGGA